MQLLTLLPVKLYSYYPMISELSLINVTDCSRVSECDKVIGFWDVKGLAERKSRHQVGILCCTKRLLVAP